MSTEPTKTESPATDFSPSPIECEETIGRLLRRLNSMCVKSLKAGNDRDATQAAELSAAVEEAMRMAGIS